jgi:xylitol oxidase
VRFVGPSRAFLSMMHERPTMAIELSLIAGTRGGERLLAYYESELAGFDARPHWGMLNALTPSRVAALYPQFGSWQAVAADFNRSGVFDSPFGTRTGLSERRDVAMEEASSSGDSQSYA